MIGKALAGLTAAAAVVLGPAAPARAAQPGGTFAGYVAPARHPYLTATVTVPRVTAGASAIWVGTMKGDYGPGLELVQVGFWDAPGDVWGWYATCGTCISQPFGGTMTAGDVVTMSVNRLADRWRVSLWDRSRHWAAWHYLAGSAIGAPLDCWIVEYRSTFGAVRFGDATPSGPRLALTNGEDRAVGRMTVTG
ncbi:MAG: hypothetical protein ACYCV4_05405 [Dermatophilaceae bacterium]